MNKKRVWEILEISKENDKKSKIFDYFISILILLNVLAIILETEKKIFGEYMLFFKYFEFWVVQFGCIIIWVVRHIRGT